MVGRRTVAATLAVALVGAGGTAVADPDGRQSGFKTQIKPYLKGVPGSGWETEPLLSVGDDVPETGNPGFLYQMTGIPDGLEAMRSNRGDDDDDDGDGRDRRRKGYATVFMNHEMPQDRFTRPRVGRDRDRGAYVSEFQLAKDGSVLSGRRAYDFVYSENTFVGPAPEEDNATPAFSRFCSHFLGLPEEVGFDRPILLTNEEASRTDPNQASQTFDPRGSSTVAVFDNEAHSLPKLGHFPKENNIVVPKTGKKTVIFSLEDGPTTPDSQLYMYVGEKQRSRGATVLRRNGLDNGKLYAFVSNDGRRTEGQLQTGSMEGRWVQLESNEADDFALEAEADAKGAFGFVRIEDGAFGPRSNRDFYFVTTGDGAENRLGRGYRLRIDPSNPTADATLTVVFNNDQEDAAGRDYAFAPDNVDVTRRYWAINEDGTGNSRPEYEQRNRDGSVWLLDLGDSRGPYTGPGTAPDAERVAELVGRSEGGRDGIRTTAGIWESSGIIDVSRIWGENWFLTDVQAHRPTTSPEGTDTEEDGQLLFLRPSDDD